MTNIELRNENGKIVGYDAETGEKVPVNFESLGTDRLHAKSLPATHRVHRDGSTYYGDGATTDERYSDTDVGGLISSILSNAATEERVRIVVQPDQYDWSTDIEFTRYQSLVAYDAEFSVSGTIRLFNDTHDGIHTAAPGLHGGRFFVSSGGFVMADALSQEFHPQVVVADGNGVSLLTVTTENLFSAKWDITGVYSSQNRDARVDHDNVTLIDMPPGTGDGNVGARGDMDVRLQMDGGTGNVGVHVQDGALMGDADNQIEFQLEAPNEILLLEGTVNGTQWDFRGEAGRDGGTPNIVRATSTASGWINIYENSIGEEFNLIEQDNSSIDVIGGYSQHRVAGTVDLGTGGSYGASTSIPIRRGRLPQVGFWISGSFGGGEEITARITATYVDGSDRQIMKSWTSSLSERDYLSPDERFNLTDQWNMIEDVTIEAKTSESSTSLSLEYRSFFDIARR